MEKQAKYQDKILKFLPRAASVITFQNPPFSPNRDNRMMRSENASKQLKLAHGRGFSGPIISMIHDEARRKPKNGDETQDQDPTSPKISWFLILLWVPLAKSGFVVPGCLASFRSCAKSKVSVDGGSWLEDRPFEPRDSDNGGLLAALFLSFLGLAFCEGLFSASLPQHTMARNELSEFCRCRRGIGVYPKGCEFLIPSPSPFETIIGGQAWMFLVRRWQCSGACGLLPFDQS
uniref:Uncharacterized protein n=1 Tax=Cannabis sativa TaxID=3483 RepID=A0A803NKT4_CANSA